MIKKETINEKAKEYILKKLDENEITQADVNLIKVINSIPDEDDNKKIDPREILGLK